MSHSRRNQRTPASLSPLLHAKLNTYTLVAGAAGVSALALAPPVEGRVIFTSIHHVIKANQNYNLDLNHDGTTDITLKNILNSDTSYCSLFAGIDALAPSANGVAAFRTLRGFVEAYALRAGTRIGAKFYFFNRAAMAGYVRSITCYAYKFGRWLNVKNRYLGVRFRIDGKDHYGWARLSVRVRGYDITATLTGYAYETVPNRIIVAGPSIGRLSPAGDTGTKLERRPRIKKLAQPPLGVLALGSEGLPMWRREREAAEPVP